MNTPRPLSRRQAVKLFGATSLCALGAQGLPLLADDAPAPLSGVKRRGGEAGFDKPQSIYITWASHDELSDNVPLTEELAMLELEAMKRLQDAGVQFDVFLMDMFWFDRRGGFRTFREKYWPKGPDRWLEACAKIGVKPGLWLSTNIMGWSLENPWMDLRPEWEGSRGGYLGQAMSLFEGGFLEWHLGTMQHWYDRGVRLFKFDFANFGAASAETLKRLSPAEIVRKNEKAWFEALKAFRQKNPEVMLLAYNGYGGDSSDTHPVFRRTVDRRWLEVFDSLYCGDPRPADVPCHNFWRAKDIYSDHQVVQYAFNQVPLKRIDNTSFMIGKTGTCYFREKSAWKGMLVLSAARGGWANTYYGNLELLDAEDARWFAKVQKLFYPLQARAHIDHFGATPGAGKPYGFLIEAPEGCVAAIVNPMQETASVELPRQLAEGTAAVLFRDAGFEPVIAGGMVTLGAEQLVLVGVGEYSKHEYNLGVQDDVVIPAAIARVPVEGLQASGQPGNYEIRGTVKAPAGGALRLIGRQMHPDGRPLRISGGSPPSGTTVGKALVLKAVQGGRPLAIVRHDDKLIWSGMSWACGEIAAGGFTPGEPVEVSYQVLDIQKRSAVLSLDAHGVT
ncbi:hypothetical protein [Nibricoccus sp. IMCC34717]|uniref:hypothetical protein n=1 Tax=Nibricoccus sp. IMCC34717 TaxID=3034021 RepID=UPI00384A76C0